MTPSAPPSRRSLKLMATAFLLPLPFLLGAFLVNIEVAIRVFAPRFHLLDHIIPAGLYRVWTILSADLSVVSTLIPLMIVAFPAAQAIRVLRAQDRDPTLAQRIGPDPYPSHFGFFQIMLGLTGTLYGMYIGLDVSGVSDLAAQGPNADTIRQALDRLLGGTATALLSSLVGLIGAFITARPIPWLFGKLTGVRSDETRLTLTATIEHLTEDLRGLSQASRTFSELLNPATAKTLFDRLDSQDAGLSRVQSQLESLATRLDTLARAIPLQERQVTALEQLVTHASEARERQDHANTLLGTALQTQSAIAERLSRLDSVDQGIRALHALLENQDRSLAQLAVIAQHSQESLRSMADGQETQRERMTASLAALSEAANAQREQVQRGQEALRQALSAYLNPSRQQP